MKPFFGGVLRVRKALSRLNVESCGLECGRPLAHPGHLQSEDRHRSSPGTRLLHPLHRPPAGLACDGHGIRSITTVHSCGCRRRTLCIASPYDQVLSEFQCLPAPQMTS